MKYFTLFLSIFAKKLATVIHGRLAQHSNAVVFIVVRLLEEHEVDEEDGSKEHGLYILIILPILILFHSDILERSFYLRLDVEVLRKVYSEVVSVGEGLSSESGPLLADHADIISVRGFHLWGCYKLYLHSFSTYKGQRGFLTRLSQKNSAILNSLVSKVCLII